MIKRMPLERLRQLSMARYARNAHASTPVEAGRRIERQQERTSDTDPPGASE
jgi:hypothetical protein